MLIAGAGGAAHLPGMAAAKTALPVLGVPVESKTLKGMDSLLSIVQMPAGDPGRDARDRPRRRGQRGAARGRDRGALGRGRPRAARALAGRADRVGAREPRPGQVTVCYLATVGVIGGGQLGRMLGARRDPARALVPLPRPLAGRPGGRGGRAARRRVRRSGAARPARRRRGRRHVRVRERPGRGGASASAPFPRRPRSRRPRTGSSRSSSSAGSGSRRRGSTTRWRRSRRS